MDSHSNPNSFLHNSVPFQPPLIVKTNVIMTRNDLGEVQEVNEPKRTCGGGEVVERDDLKGGDGNQQCRSPISC